MSGTELEAEWTRRSEEAGGCAKGPMDDDTKSAFLRLSLARGGCEEASEMSGTELEAEWSAITSSRCTAKRRQRDHKLEIEKAEALAKLDADTPPLPAPQQCDKCKKWPGVCKCAKKPKRSTPAALAAFMGWAD